MADPTATLTYAASPAREGIILEPLPDGVRITKPAKHPSGILLLLVMVLLSPLLLILLPFLILSGGGISTVYRSFGRGDKPLSIEVTSSIVAIRNIEVDGTLHDLVRPRDAVYDVKFVPHSGNLVIRAKGHEMIDCHLFSDPRTTQWAADVLCEALGLNATNRTLPPRTKRRKEYD